MLGGLNYEDLGPVHRVLRLRRYCRVSARLSHVAIFPTLDLMVRQCDTSRGWSANPNYGFSVRIPDGLTGHDGPAPMPHHGFGIVLSWQPRAYVEFDGSYRVGDDSLPLIEEAERLIKWRRAESESVRSVSRTSARLGPLPAQRVLVYRTCKGHAGVFVADQIVALGHQGRTVYSARLLTTSARYPARQAVVRGLARDMATRANRVSCAAQPAAATGLPRGGRGKRVSGRAVPSPEYEARYYEQAMVA